MASKDWTGNSIANLKTMGASSHASYDREQHDYYATEPKAVRLFLEQINLEGPVWECACGEGHLSEEMKAMGFDVYSSDLIARGYGEVKDFLCLSNKEQTDRHIITNPPYKFANEFMVKGYNLLKPGNKLCLFLPIRYLEGKARKILFAKYPPKEIWVSSGRLICAMNGRFEQITGSAASYSWFVWEKDYAGPTTLKWFN